MWAKINKFAPFVAVLGYLFVYSSKGYDRILIDLQGITIDKLQAKWQNIAIAIGAGIALHLMKGIRLPVALKGLITIALYALIGYNLALTIDPPAPSRGVGASAVRYVQPVYYNPYQAGVGGR